MTMTTLCHLYHERPELFASSVPQRGRADSGAVRGPGHRGRHHPRHWHKCLHRGQGGGLWSCACVCVYVGFLLGVGSMDWHHPGRKRIASPARCASGPSTRVCVGNVDQFVWVCARVDVRTGISPHPTPPYPTPKMRPQVSKLSKWRPAGAKPDTLTAINTEWGCYSSDLLPRWVAED